MRILGVDPGFAIIGYGVIDTHPPSVAECVAWGCVKTDAGLPLPSRLQIIYEDFSEVLRRYEPDVVVLEKLYFKKNVTTGLKVSAAIGVILLCIAQKGLPYFEYSALEVKSKLLGYGHAEKTQVQYIVRNNLSLPELPQPDDAADGLAVALCHFYSFKQWSGRGDR